MSSTPARSDAAIGASRATKADMSLEVVVVPVSDVERAKRFYGDLGWRLDGDFAVGDEFRGVQFTPPGSQCSIHFGKGITSAAPGSAVGMYLCVSHIEAARAELLRTDVDVSPVFHRTGPGQPAMHGLHPERHSYSSFASFNDPDGNAWLLQEVTMRFPGRVEGSTYVSAAHLASALRRAEAAHGEHEKQLGRRDEDWPSWYADFMVREQAGGPAPT